MPLVPTAELMNSSTLRRPVAMFVAAVIAFLGSLAAPVRAEIDETKTQQVWRLKYGVSNADVSSPAWLALDTDGDGSTNAEELAAGTNPFSPSKAIRVTSVALSGGNAQLTFPTELGKRYQAERKASLASGTYAAVGSVVTGTGSPMMISIAHTGTSFYQIRVFDHDSDGDGLADWLEQATGLNPNSPPVGGNPDLTEYNFVAAQVALPNEVNIKASVPFASEDGPTGGKFVVTRTQKLLPLTVTYNTTGTATPVIDYSTLPGTVNFASGTDTIEVGVEPAQNTPATEGSESVTATLVAPGGPAPLYVLGANDKATVIIADKLEVLGTGLLARYYDSASGTYADVQNFGQNGTYVYDRVGNSPFTGSTITVPFTYNGTPALQAGQQVKIDFTSGNLNGVSGVDNVVHTVTTVTAGVSFVVLVSGASLPNDSSGNCNFKIESFTHPPVIERVDSTVNFDWGRGTPNGNTITVGAVQTNQPDNYSSAWEGYLSPSTGGAHTFQIDADDKGRVLLDLNGDGDFYNGAELDAGEQVAEHGWDAPATVGTFNVGSPVTLAVPANPAQRYKIRVEHVETTGAARCRVQWRGPTGGFANIPQGNVFPHTQAMSANYSFTRTVDTANADQGTITVTLNGHGLVENDPVELAFSSGVLFTPANGNFHGPFTVAPNPTTNTFVVNISASSLPATSANSGAGFVLKRPNSTTTGWFNQIYANTSFTGSLGRVGVDGTGATTQDNGIYGEGTPSAAQINPDTFSIRWTGQVQPQFSEEYTFVVQADDGCALYLNGQLQEMRTAPTTLQGGSVYYYNGADGNTTVDFFGAPAKPGSYSVGENVRVDPSGGNLLHSPNTSPTYSYDSVTGVATIDYSNLTNSSPNPGATRLTNSYTAGEVVELDPITGNATSLVNLPYTVLASPAPTATTFAISLGVGAFTTGSGNITITDNRNAVITAVHASGTGTYTYTSTTGATIVTYAGLSGAAPGSIAAGQTVLLDPTAGTASGLNYAPYVVAMSPAPTATTFAVTLQTSLGNQTTGAAINILDPANAAIPSAATAFSINIGSGKYANASTGTINLEIVNKALKDFGSMGNERYVRMPVQAGVRYDIQLDYYENTGYARSVLSWYSPSQPKQVIPTERLYPGNVTQAPPAHVAATDATALVGGAFSQVIAGSNAGTVSISGNPAWLTYANGVLSGTPPPGTAGDYQIVITITNAAGTSTSVLNLRVENTGSPVVREYWTGVAGTSVASIPTSTAPTSADNLTTLEGPTDFGDNYGARVRGFITAPTTGNYYFWVAASNAAELWISNDDDAINAYKRCWVTAGSTTPRTWNVHGTQKSAWLALEQGKKYYFELLHKAGTGAGDNVAVGWSKPGEATTAPSEVVPAYALSTYVEPAAGSTPGTLYVATMLAQAGAVTDGVGTATLRVSEDETVAYLRYTHSGLTGPIVAQHIHIDPNPGHNNGEIVFDIDDPETPGDGMITDPNDPNEGAYKWTINAIGTYDPAEIVNAIKAGKAYVNLHTSMYLDGEIRGNFTYANGSRTFTVPPDPLSWTDDSLDDAAAARFLAQATFGANTADIAALQALAATGADASPGVNRPASRYDKWIDNQFLIPATAVLPEVLAREIGDVFGPFDVRVVFDSWWKVSMTAPDQLRQRVAYALSQIHVVSGQGPLEDNSRAIADFYDTLAENAFGSFNSTLLGTTLAPGMGRYLDMLRNDKPDLGVGRIPNENYAREIKQLFAIGLYQMWPDGTLKLNKDSSLIDTYSQREIVGLAHVFTGWDYGYDGSPLTSFSAAANWTRPMRAVPARHFTGPKRVLNNEVLPGLTTANGQPLDPYATHTATTLNDTAYQNLAVQENVAVHDMLFNHPNTGPFICRQLIQRMVTSHPSREYLYRVVQKFNDNGSGVRGDMKAVIKAVLLDYEARSPQRFNIPAHGKQREPILRVANAARSLRPAAVSGNYSQTGLLNNVGVPYIGVAVTSPAAGHLYSSNNNVFLEFAGGTPPPTTGTYSVLGNPTPTATTFAVAAPGWLACAYNQLAGETEITITTLSSATHSLPGVNANQPSLPAANWGQAYFDFTSGSLDGLAGFDRTARTVTSSSWYDTPSGVGNTDSVGVAHSFKIAAPNTNARSGNVMIARFNGSYQSTGAGGIITIDTAYGGLGAFGFQADHHLNVGDPVFLNFLNSRDTTSFQETSTQNDIAYTVLSVIDANTFTVQARPDANAAMNSDNQVTVFPLLAQPLSRTGTVNARQGTYQMDNTDTDLSQTPLNSPTVFNYYLPDYKFAGTLASQGITTPEFELTAETTTVRQANFLFSGVFNPTGQTTGISGFAASSANNGLALVMDLSPWMGLATSTVLGNGPETGQMWTSNANLSALIDRLDTLVAAGQMGTAAKASILKFLYRPGFTIPASATDPCKIVLANHGLANGDSITITGVSGGTFRNDFNNANVSINQTFTVAGVTPSTPNEFTLSITGGIRCTATPGTGVANAYITPSSVPYTTGTTTQIRDRVRSILHLILSSPDFTVQR